MPNGQSQRDVLIRIITQAAREGARQAIEDLRELQKEQQAAAESARSASQAWRDASNQLMAYGTNIVPAARSAIKLLYDAWAEFDKQGLLSKRTFRDLGDELKRMGDVARGQDIRGTLRDALAEAATQGGLSHQTLKQLTSTIQGLAPPISQLKIALTELAVKGFGVLQTAVESVGSRLSDFVRRHVTDLARSLAELLNPFRYLQSAVSSLWDILKQAFGYALGRMIVAFVKDPIGALQDLERTIFGLTSELSILQMQLEVMLPEAFGTAGQAMDYLWDMILRTSAGIDELTGGIKVLTAYGIDYRQWLELLTDVAAGTGKSVESLAYAIGLVSQGTARGIYYLRLAGVNVRELGIETNKLGRLTGSTTDALMKLFVGLEKQYGGMSAKVGKSFRIVLQNLADFVSRLWVNVWDPIVGTDGVLTKALNRLYGLFVDVDRRALTPLSQNLLALASVVGERLAGAFQRLEGFVSETVRGMRLNLYELARWGLELCATIADGILTGIDQYIIPAIVAVTEVIAAFLAPGSPPKRGLLRYINQWGILIFEEFLKGFARADFSLLDEATGILRNILRVMAATGDISEKEMIPALAAARTELAELISTFRETGVLDETILARIVARFGQWGDEVETLIRLHVQLTAEQEKLAALERKREDVQEQIRETVLRMRREGYTEEAIQAWREWFTRTELGDIDKEIEAQQDVISELEDQYSWQQELINAQMDQIGLIEEQISLLERLERAVRRAARRARELAEGLIVGPPPELPIDVPSLMADLEELKQKWRDILDDLLKPFEKLEKHWQRIGDFVRGFLGVVEKVPTRGWETAMAWETPETPEYQAGAGFRQALSDIAFNIIPAVKAGIDAITTAVSLSYAEWVKIANLFDPVKGELGWLGTAIKAGAAAIGMTFTVQDPETGESYIDVIMAGLGLAGLAVAGIPGLAFAILVGMIVKDFAWTEKGFSWERFVTEVLLAGAVGLTFGGPYGAAIAISAVLVITGIEAGILDKIQELVAKFPHLYLIAPPEGPPEPLWFERPGYRESVEAMQTTFDTTALAASAYGGALLGAQTDLKNLQKAHDLYLPLIYKGWETLKSDLVGQSLVPDMMEAIIAQFESLKARLVGGEGEGEEGGIIPSLRAKMEEILTNLKTATVGEEGIIPTMVTNVIDFFHDWYEGVMGEEPKGWLRKFVDNAVDKLQELYDWAKDAIKKLKELIDLRDEVGDGGGGGGGGQAQFGLIVPRTGRYLLHRGEYVFNPDFPRMDIAAAIIRSLGPNLSRLVPDLSEALRALPTPMVRPQFALAGGTGDVHYHYYFSKGAITLKVPSQVTGRSFLEELTRQAGPRG